MGLVKVKYLGVADIRTITAKEWKGAGVVVDHDVVWNRSNGYTVVLDASPRMEEVLRGEQHFSIDAVDDDGGSTVIATASDPKAEGDILVDGNTGQKSPSKKGQ